MGLDERAISNDLQIAQQWRNHREQAYELGISSFIENSCETFINGIKCKVHKNLNMYWDITSTCPCNCNFCIAKVHKREQTCPTYIKNSQNAIIITKHLNPSLQITGGEPTVVPSLLSVLCKCAATNNMRNKVLNTNGFALNSMIEILNNSDFSHINISRHHYNESVSDEIFHTNINSNLLEESIKHLKSSVRLQCNMIGGYIDTYGEIMQYIAFAYHKLKVTNIAFAQLTPLPRNSFYDKDIIDYCEAKPVDVDTILGNIEKNSNFKFEKCRAGVACYYEVWKYMGYDKPMTIIFKYSDNKYLEMVDDMPEMIPDLILHTDGRLCGSWNKDKKILSAG